VVKDFVKSMEKHFDKDMDLLHIEFNSHFNCLVFVNIAIAD
jgi:hypothetical protein